MWPCALSGRLSIFGLVGFYPANYLIDRGLLSRRLAPFFFRTYAVLAQVSPGYSPPRGRYPRVTHQCATLLRIAPFLVRLACVKRAASVDSEPGSNSRLNPLFCDFPSTFYPMSDGPSMRNHRITMLYFRTCSTCKSRSQAPLCHYTLRTITNRTEGTFRSLRYFFGGDHPSQTTHHALSSLELETN